MMKNLILSLAVLIAIPALALSGSRIGVEGYVTAFDNTTITIESGNQKIEIPRKLYAYKVKAGEKIVVSMEQKDFDAIVKQDTKPAKK
jgi:hypothetical protein